MGRGMKDYRIAVIPGDGVGTEVSAEATRIAEAAAKKYGFGITFDTFDWSCDRYLEVGESYKPLEHQHPLWCHDCRRDRYRLRRDPQQLHRRKPAALYHNSHLALGQLAYPVGCQHQKWCCRRRRDRYSCCGNT